MRYRRMPGNVRVAGGRKDLPRNEETCRRCGRQAKIGRGRKSAQNLTRSPVKVVSPFW